VFVVEPAVAQTPSAGRAVFFGVKKSDRVGKVSAKPDGKPDAVFSLTLDPWPGAARVTEIQIQTLSGTAGLWDTIPGKAVGALYLGVAGAKNPSKIINRKGGPLNLNSQKRNDLLLFANGESGFSDKNRQYQITVTYADGTSATIPVTNEIAPAALDVGEESGGYPVRMSAVIKGISNYDAVGPTKEMKGDNKADGLFQLKIEAPNKIITGLEIRNVDGTPSVWDTIPGSKAPAIGVALTSEPVRLLNKPDSSIAIPVKNRLQLNLYVADNGGIAAGKTGYRILVTFRDGEASWCPVQKDTAVNFLATWLGFMPTDAVGPYPKLKPDGKPDAVFGLDIEVSPNNTITGIEIQNSQGVTKWATPGTAPNAWGLAVAYPAAPKALLNKPDGSVSIPLDRRAQFYVYGAPGDLATTTQKYWMVVHLANGLSYKQIITKGLPSTSVVPGSVEPEIARGVVTCEFRGFIADLVNTSTKPGKDGYLDGTFLMKLHAEEKKLAMVEIAGTDGAVRWSSRPKAPQMFLGVALYPNVYKLINAKGGYLNTPISGRKTVYLYAADNGMLSDPRVKLVVTVTFTDKTKLTTEVIK
jgi:hypothetical protein